MPKEQRRDSKNKKDRRSKNEVEIKIVKELN
jgi:hypothetical protein